MVRGQPALHGARERDEPRVPRGRALLHPQRALLPGPDPTAALEHLTATFGELALDSEMLDRVHPTMRDLLRWHAAEEIEHRDVAFDVFQAVDGRWIVRVGGFLMAVTVLGAFWASGTRHLLRQDPPAKRSDRRVERTELRAFWRRNGPRFAKNVLSYLKPGFHPRQMETDHLAEGYFADSALA